MEKRKSGDADSQRDSKRKRSKGLSEGSDGDVDAEGEIDTDVVKSQMMIDLGEIS